METNNNYKIAIDDIENSSDKSLELEFNDFIEGIKSKNTIKSFLTIKSLGDFIQVTGKISGYVTLTCDLCLEEFEYELAIDIDETYTKNTLIEDYQEEVELKSGQFVTELAGSKEIDILDLLYQSVILDFPNKKVCGINCKGGDIFIRDEEYQQENTDPRMSVFKDIEIKPKK